MNEPKHLENANIIALLSTLQAVPAREPRKASRGRASFLAEAETFDKAVSPSYFFRLKEWISTIPLPEMEKEKHPMFAAVVTGLTALVLFVSGVGATVWASQDALPGDPLFSVKTSAEDVRLLLSFDDEGDLALHTLFIDLRESEIEALQDAERTEDVSVAELDIAKHEEAIAALKAKLGLEDPVDVPAEDNSNSSNENSGESQNDNTDANSNSNSDAGDVDNGNSNNNTEDDDNANDNSNDDDGDDNSNDNDDDNGNDNSNDNDDDNGDDNSNDNDDDDNGDDNSNDNDDDDDGDDNSNDNDDDDDGDDNSNDNDDDDDDSSGSGSGDDDDDDDD